MHIKDEFAEIIENVDLLLLELKIFRAAGPHLRILHQYRVPGSDCCPGEEVGAVYLVHRTREFPLRLSCTMLVVFDYLARHSYLPQTASQITAGMRADAFCSKHGANVSSVGRLVRKLSRASVKEYIKRMRAALGQTFHDAHLPLDPYGVLASEVTSSNQVGYRLRANCEWVHIDHPSR